MIKHSYKWALAALVCISLSCMESAGVASDLPLPSQTVTAEGALVRTPTGAPAEPAGFELAKVCASVNVRQSPFAVGPVLYWLTAGDSVQVHERRGEWARIGEDRWIVSAVLC